MSQISRCVIDAVDGVLNGKRYLIYDCDPLFTAELQSIFAGVGVKSVKLPPQSPNLNAYAERFVRSIKESYLERLILFFWHRQSYGALRDYRVHFEIKKYFSKGDSMKLVH